MKNTFSFDRQLVVFLVFSGFLLGISLVAAPNIYNIFRFNNTLINLDAAAVSLEGFDASIVIYLFFHYFVISYLGYLFTRSFFNDVSATLLVKVISGFFIGYILVCGILRLLTLFLPFEWIYAGGMFVVVSSIILIKLLCRNHVIPPTVLPITQNQRMGLYALQLAGYLLFVSSLLLLQIFQGDFAWVGHGYQQYAYLLDTMLNEEKTYFPIFTQHYDEIIFHYFLCAPLPKTFSAIIPWWMTLAFTKISMASFLYLLFRKFSASVVTAVIFTGFMMAGTSSLLLWKYYILFDSSNFLYFTVHSGRIVGIGFVLLLLTINLYPIKKSSILFIMLAALAGLGLATTNIINSFWAIVIYFAVIVYWIYYVSKTASPGTDTSQHKGILSYISVVVILMMYALPFDARWAHGVRALLAGGMALWIVIRNLILLKSAFSGKAAASKGLWIPLLCFLVFSLIGLLIGNVPAGIPVMKKIWKQAEKHIMSIRQPSLVKDQGANHPSVLGDYRKLGDYNQYCRGLGPFIAYYGGILTLLLAANYLLSQKIRNNRHAVYDDVMYEMLILCVGLLPLLFLFVDFINLGPPAWVKTRFLEFPVYIIIFIFFYSALAYQGRKIYIFILILIAAYTVIPFLATKRPSQMMYNAGILKQVIGAKGAQDDFEKGINF